jgi:dihydrodipicolinate synthase/N-acetylneuraminate lyase
MIYNYPGAAGGIDMDSDTIVEIARENANICGVKLTCGAVGKLTRIGAGVTNLNKQLPRAAAVAPEFIVLGGFADFLLPTIAGGRAHGAIMGLANVYPRAIRRLFDLSLALQANPEKEALAEALRLQDLCAGADAALARAGIPGTKAWLKTHNNYGGSARVRRPLLEFPDDAAAALEKDEVVQAFYAVEQGLAK